MRIRQSSLRQRAEKAATHHSMRQTRGGERGGSRFGEAVRRVLAGLSDGGARRPGAELEKLGLPDLLSLAPVSVPNPEPLLNLLDLAFLGRASAGELDRELEAMSVEPSSWVRPQFADDLFLTELVRGGMATGADRTPLPVHLGFVTRVLVNPPADAETVSFRQGILRELEEEPAVLEAAHQVFGGTLALLALLKASRDDARLEPLRFRFDVLRAFRSVVEQMAEDFAGSASGLRRLHEVGEEIRSSRAYGRMRNLVEHHERMATLGLEVFIGGDGRLRHLEIRRLSECKGNPFYRRPLRRWWDRARLVFRSYRVESDELVDRLLHGVYQEIAPALARVVQAVCHLEVYVAARAFAADARHRGLEVCLPEMTTAGRLELRDLFNPLLLPLMERPVPTDVEAEASTILLTGPNSGGKTRLLQGIGIAQVLGQSGLYVPCSRARMPVVESLFASIVEVDRADQAEGRLGTELMRLRLLFETVPPGSLVLLDELCSGTNPSEAIEIVEMVLRLLRKLRPLAFVTTHFLDFAERLRSDGGGEGLSFLQAEVDGEIGPTFRFIPGVASTSLAAGTARRLGVTFEELERKLSERACGPGADE